MPNPRRPKRILLPALVLLLIVASVGGLYAYQQLNPPASCSAPLGGAKILRTQLASQVTFGGVTEFTLPTPLRSPNAPTVAPDGSVWFAEQSVAGLGHFYPGNRTLVEYAWPYDYPAPPSPGGVCGEKTSVWGVALWNGKVWASDEAGNQLVALEPSSGATTTVKFPTNGSFPYTLTLGPDGTLWVAELFVPKIGELSSNGTMHEYQLPGGINAEPSQVIFANSTTGFYVDVRASDPNGGGVFSFNLTHFAPKLFGGQHLSYPSSIAIASGTLWVTLHGSSSLAGYNFTTRSWASYPSTPISYSPTTLPYFVYANGSLVWFNEHIGNKIAKLDPASNSLVEYSESSDRTLNGSIGNALTFTLGGGRAWFTELTGNVLGYVDASYTPGFSTSIAGNRTIVVNRGSNASVNFIVHSTTHQGALNLSFADSETLTSKPSDLTFTAPGNSLSPPPGGGSSVKVTVSASQSLKPGTYFAILTATDGLTYESSFLKIVVPG
jgi:virginiamycin B lyase